jgi:hypothetical protein
MSKITDFKFAIKGVDYKVNVNCTSSGLFTANIPKEVALALNIQEKLSFPTLNELDK